MNTTGISEEVEDGDLINDMDDIVGNITAVSAIESQGNVVIARNITQEVRRHPH